MLVEAVLLLLAITILWLNFKASLSIWNDTLSETKQRVLQLLLVWLIPLLGSLIVIGIHRPYEKPSGRHPDEQSPPDDFMGRTVGSQRADEIINDD